MSWSIISADALRVFTMLLIAFVAFGMLAMVFPQTPMVKNLADRNQLPVDSLMAQPIAIEISLPETLCDSLEKFIWENLAGVKWVRNH